MKLTNKYVTAEMEEILKRAIKQRRRSMPKKRIQMLWPAKLWREIQSAIKRDPTTYTSVTQFVLIACRRLLDSIKPGQ